MHESRLALRCAHGLPEGLCNSPECGGDPGTFVKHDQDKLRFDLIDHEFEAELAAILTHGAKKYADDNWKKAEPTQAKRRYYAAFRRHILAYLRGEVIDPDSGQPNLACATCCLMFLRWFQRREAGP